MLALSPFEPPVDLESLAIRLTCPLESAVPIQDVADTEQAVTPVLIDVRQFAVDVQRLPKRTQRLLVPSQLTQREAYRLQAVGLLAPSAVSSPTDLQSLPI